MYNVSITDTYWHSMRTTIIKPKVYQINIKIEEDDLIKIDSKAKKYGLSRSAMLKLLGLNAEIDFPEVKV